MNKTYISLILIPLLLVSGLSFSQELNRETAAEDLFKTYHGWGPTIGFDQMFVTGEPTRGVVTDYLAPVPVNFGLNWNFYQKDNWSFRLGGYYRFYKATYNEFYPAIETPVDFDFEIDFRDWPYENAKFNLTAEYIYPLNLRWGLNFGLGVEALYYREDLSYGPGGTRLADIRLQEYVNNSARTNWYFGPNIELGLDLKTRDFLYRLKLLYHYNASPPQNKVTVLAQNMQQTDDNVTVQVLTGSYVGFTLSAYPSKALFKKRHPEHKKDVREKPVRKMFREQYLPVGINLGLDFMHISSFDSNFMDTETTIPPAMSLGVQWNYFNPGRMGFRLGATYRSYSKSHDVFVPKGTSGTNTNAYFNYKSPNVHTWRLNHNFEYYIPLSGKLQLVPALGMELLYNVPFEETEKFYEIEGDILVGVFDMPIIDLESRQMLLNANAELGLDVKARDFLLRFKMVYSFNFTYFSNAIETVVVNRETGISFGQTAYITNNYFGIGVTVNPSRNLFAKKTNP